MTPKENALARLHNASMNLFGRALKLAKRYPCARLHRAARQVEGRRAYTRGSVLARQFMRFLYRNIGPVESNFIITADMAATLRELTVEYLNCQEMLASHGYSTEDYMDRADSAEKVVREQTLLAYGVQCAL